MHIQEEAARCLFCQDAPCTKACAKGDPARAVRAIRFDNEALAAQFGISSIPCVILFENGKVAEQSIGLRPKDFFLEMLGE